MNNIEKLAIEHGIIEGYYNSSQRTGILKKLEAFAKALQQSSEPVAWRHKKYPECVYGSLESFTIHHADKSLAEPLFDHPPASVPLEKYNKLLDALKRVPSALLITHNAQIGAFVNLNEVDLIARLIAEAEGKEG